MCQFYRSIFIFICPREKSFRRAVPFRLAFFPLIVYNEGDV